MPCRYLVFSKTAAVHVCKDGSKRLHQHRRVRDRASNIWDVVSVAGRSISNGFGMPVDTCALKRRSFDTLIVVGGARWTMRSPDIGAIQLASSKVRRLASVCTGAFVLAQCGLLDGRRVTTHWRWAAELQREHAAVRVESDSIFIKAKRRPRPLNG
jgi:transcriptional regulator GlxA family with amidase domain